ncbi:MBL fold metallo-hydrolase, partial [Streptomyces sp. SID7499]|nr:MBL fold metallo-hydrolase [Streptomyces sp. SID7499]
PDLHLNGREAGEAAARAGARRLVLTHIPPWTDADRNAADARAVYKGPVELAAPGAVYEL